MEPFTVIEILVIVSWIASGMLSMLYVWLKEEEFDTLGELVIMQCIGAVAGWVVLLMILMHVLDGIKLPKTKLGNKFRQLWSLLWNYKLKK